MSRPEPLASTVTSPRREATEPPSIDWLDPRQVARVRDAVVARTCYRDKPAPIDLVQTHISSVFLTSRHVFKFKRPLDVGFADFRNLAQREHFCRQELALNRRLAEGVYLDVLPLRAEGERLWLDGDQAHPQPGPVVDWCVVMRRLPTADMLDHRLRYGRVSPAQWEALAHLLVAFHRDAAGGPELARYGSLAVVQGNWEENFAQTEAFVDQAISREDFEGIHNAVRDWLASHATLLAEREASGAVRDGHGDLRCEHVYLGNPIKVIDCIEFNDRFRYADVANDLAFLLMDLTAQGHPAEARALMERYVALSGDASVARLVAFYACYRAYVRGKVTAFKLGDRNLSARKRASVQARARAFFRLAHDFAAQMCPPVLVLVGGLMGTGKTSLADALASAAGIAVFNSDALRKELAGEKGHTGASAAFGAGIYTPVWNARTYQALFALAEGELGAGRSVVLDASFARRADRDRALSLAARYGARAVLVECRLDEARTLQRLRKRSRSGNSLSDGREELYEHQRAGFEPVHDWPPEAHLIITTDRPAHRLTAGLLPHLALPPPLFGTAS